MGKVTCDGKECNSKMICANKEKEEEDQEVIRECTVARKWGRGAGKC